MIITDQEDWRWMGPLPSWSPLYTHQTQATAFTKLGNPKDEGQAWEIAAWTCGVTGQLQVSSWCYQAISNGAEKQGTIEHTGFKTRRKGPQRVSYYQPSQALAYTLQQVHMTLGTEMMTFNCELNENGTIQNRTRQINVLLKGPCLICFLDKKFLKALSAEKQRFRLCAASKGSNLYLQDLTKHVVD